MDEGLGLLLVGILLGALLSGIISHGLTKESMQVKAVDLGVAEYYLDQDYQTQFRYKEAK